MSLITLRPLLIRRPGRVGAWLTASMTLLVLGASSAYANPDPQPSTGSIPLLYNADPQNGAAQPLLCPMGPPGVTQSCTGQLTVRAQPTSVGYVDWHMNGPPVITGAGGTFSYNTSAAYSCYAVPGNPSGAEPGSGFCTLTGFTFTPSAAYAGQAASLVVTINWIEQGPDNDSGQTSYSVNNPLLAAPNSITISTEAYGTAAVSSSTVNCPSTAQSVTSTCGTVTVTAQGGPIEVPSTGFLTSTDTTNFGAVANGTCTAGLSLTAGQSCTTGVLTFAPKSPGGFSNTLTIAPVEVASTQLLVSGTGLSGNPAGSPASISCPETNVGHTSTCSGATITAAGYATISSVSIADTANFSVSAGTCTTGDVLAPGTTCATGAIQFHPVTGLAVSSNLLITSNWGAVSIPVSAPRSFGVAVISPPSLACGDSGQGITKSCGTLTFTSSGGESTFLSDASVGDTTNYSMTPGTCRAGTLLAAGQSCTTGAISFKPSAAGQSYSTQVSFSADAGAESVTLTGTGIYGTASLSSSSINCGSVGVDATSACNSGLTLSATNGPVQLAADGSSLAVTPGEFSIAPGSCTPGALIASGSSCTTGAVSFSPDGAQSFSGSVSFAQVGGASTSASLTGVGIYGTPTFTPTLINCGSIGYDLAQVCNAGAGVTLTASGGPVFFDASATPVVALPVGSYNADPGTCTAGLHLTAGESCTTGPVSFTPASAQSYPGSLNFSLVSGSSAVPLSGTGLLGTPSFTGSFVCSNTEAGSSSACTGTVTVSATGGSVSFSGISYYSNQSEQFSLAAGTCTPGAVILEGESCTTGVLTFNAPASSQGTYSTIVYLSTNNGSTNTGWISATSTFGTPVLSGGISCPATVEAGTSQVCSGTYTISNSGGGPVILTDVSQYTNNQGLWFAFDVGTCTAGTVLQDGQACTTGALTASPPVNYQGGFANIINFSTDNSSYSNLSSGWIGSTSTYGTPALTGAFNCPSTQAGTTSVCTGVLTLTNSGGGPLILNSVTQYTNNSAEWYSLDDGSCLAGTTLQDGQSCTTGLLTFSPPVGYQGGAGTIVYFNTDNGTPNTSWIYDTSTFGTPAISGAMSCPPTEAGTSNPCTGVLTLTNMGGGPLILNSVTQYTNNSAEWYSLDDGSCTQGLILQDGQSCTTGLLTYSPPVGYQGEAGTIVYFNTDNGSLNTSWIYTMSTFGTPALTGSINCPITEAGTSNPCTGVLTLTNSGGGPLILNSVTQYTNNSAEWYSLDDGSCTQGLILQDGQSCTTGLLTIAPPVSYQGGTGTIVYFNTDNGSPNTGWINDTSTFGTPALSGSISCPSTEAGTTRVCTGVLTLTNSGGGPLILNSVTQYTNNAGEWYSLDDGSCTQGLILQDGQSCTTGALTFAPPVSYQGGAGTIVYFNTDNGSPNTGWVSDSSTFGTPALTGAISCPSTEAGTSSVCTGTLTLTNSSGGPMILNSVTQYTNNAGEYYSFDAGTCSNGLTLQDGESCTTGFVTYSPPVNYQGGAGTIVYFNTDNGSLNTGWIYAASTFGTPVLTGGFVCPSTPEGASQVCTGAVTLTNSGGGPLIFSSVTQYTNNGGNYFPIDAGTCTAGLILQDGQSCTSGLLTYSPPLGYLGTAGTIVFFNTDNGSLNTGWINAPSVTTAWVATGVACLGGSGAWSYSAWSPAATTCDAPGQARTGSCVQAAGSGTLTQTVTCEGVGGAVLPDSQCLALAEKPATSGPCTPTGNAVCGSEGGLAQSTAPAGCTYAWGAPGFNACVSASSSWVYSAWTPAEGCGVLTQSRTGLCTAGAGTQSRTITCESADGTPEAAALCSGVKPVATQSCTVSTPGTNCGAESSLSQSATLSDACSTGTTGTGGTGTTGTGGTGTTGAPTGTGATAGYSWGSCTYSACTGGSASWTPSSWTPASGSACTETLHQTRAVTCVPMSGSGNQTCTATCEDAQGNPAAAALCGSSPPSQSCTPTAASCTGTMPPTAKTALDHGACGPASWVSSGFAACTGGSGAFNYLTWTPAQGCGLVTQTSVGTCTPAPGSGTQSQTVTCTATDGAPTSPSECASPAPASTQACTPDSSVCSAGPPQTRTMTLTDCDTNTVGTGPCIANPSQGQFCVVVPLNTQ